jgi:aspartyl-tRNA(Asn)/glutamyl-tRNA(Gln) amidotransferase subunit B
LPELPREKQKRFQKEFGLTEKQAGILIEDKKLADFFESAVSELATMDNETTSEIGKRPQSLLFNYLTSDLIGLLNEHGENFTDMRITPENMAELIDLIADGKIMSRQAKDILRKMYETGDDPSDILESEGLHTVSGGGELDAVVVEVIAENPAAVLDYKKGKEQSMQFLIGKAMGKLKGRGNPEVLRKTFLENI